MNQFNLAGKLIDIKNLQNQKILILEVENEKVSQDGENGSLKIQIPVLVETHFNEFATVIKAFYFENKIYQNEKFNFIPNDAVYLEISGQITNLRYLIIDGENVKVVNQPKNKVFANVTIKGFNEEKQYYLTELEPLSVLDPELDIERYYQQAIGVSLNGLKFDPVLIDQKCMVNGELSISLNQNREILILAQQIRKMNRG